MPRSTLRAAVALLGALTMPAGPNFDDSNWGRYQTDELADQTGGYGGTFEFGPTHTWCDRFHLRTRFGISDPAAAQDLSLELAYLGGAAVHLNGKEVGRGHLPAGALDAAAFAAGWPRPVRGGTCESASHEDFPPQRDHHLCG